MNWPMIFTVIRIVMVPVYAWTFRVNVLYATLIVALAGLTDLLDGYLARRLKMTSSWGALLDPLADKLMLLAVLYNLMDSNLIPSIIFYLVLIKESAMVAGASLLLMKGQHIKAGWVGKATTGCFFAAILMIPIGYSTGIELLYTGGQYLLYLAMVLMVVALVTYGLIFTGLLKPARHIIS